MTILAIETSCDDTAVAVVSNGNVRSNIISSQLMHNLYGGIVPELASRAHVKTIAQVTRAALTEADCGVEHLDAVAVTYGPGLAGSLVVGTQFAKGFALRHSLPLIPIHHIEAHVYSPFMEEPTLQFPAIVLVVSGGHTSLFHVHSFTEYDILGSTKDDAAGEAFDKIAKMLGLGYPGGPIIDRMSMSGDGEAILFPRALLREDSLDFSFSGLKTSVRYYVRDLAVKTVPSPLMENICASAQRAIVDVLVHKTIAAAATHNVRTVAIAGGVSANTELRERMQRACAETRCHFVAPRPAYSVDNAAMIGFLAERRFDVHDRTNGLDVTVAPNALRSQKRASLS